MHSETQADKYRNQYQGKQNEHSNRLPVSLGTPLSLAYGFPSRIDLKPREIAVHFEEGASLVTEDVVAEKMADAHHGARTRQKPAEWPASALQQAQAG